MATDPMEKISGSIREGRSASMRRVYVSRVVFSQLGVKFNAIDFPQGEKERHEDRSDDKTNEAEKNNTAERGKKDEERMHLRVASHKLRPQNIVNGRNDQNTDRKNCDAFPYMSENEHDDADRHPHQSRADHRKKREKDHDDCPDHWRCDTGEEKNHAADGALHQADH